MAEQTKIEWTDATFNPWIGCTKVSPACDHCYAEISTPARTHKVIWGAKAERQRTSASNWNLPRRWDRQHAEFFAEHGRRRRVFCASLADVFDNAVAPAWREDLFKLIAETPNLDWLLLTKRIGNVGNMLPVPFGFDRLYPNVWLGATICNQAEADRDIPKLLEVPAAVRFLSIEPLLGPINLKSIDIDGHSQIYPLLGTTDCEDDDGNPVPDLPALDWIIVGGESGQHARPMHPDWVRDLREQCIASATPFLFKQWGEWKPISQMSSDETRGLYVSKVKADPHESQEIIDDVHGRRCTATYTVVHLDGSTHDILESGAWIAGAMQTYRVGKKEAGRALDGRTWTQFPHQAATIRTEGS